jgi:hypothetical protein
MPGGIIEETWKSMAKQSERQFGAFCVLYCLEAAKSFALPPEIPQFRNKVIHEGYIPTEAEVMDFGRRVFTLMRGIEEVLDKIGEGHTDYVQSQSLATQEAEIPPGMESAILQAFGVRVGPDNEVIGTPETFEELMQLNSKGWSSSQRS